MMMAMSRPTSIAATSYHGVKRHEEGDDLGSSRRRPPGNMDGAGRYSQTTTTHIEGGGTECS
jgi:hypothetical protein